ncbi:MAG: hypothetical protein UY07_C0004G0021 [Parcubacteria group bacterium GW2011_GWA1_47_8]|nr:MAG: hypothetical protein UY07_C0004G0021 [Parcubacteria group bacterium GW2011_GWA1_47_8]
MKIVLATPLYPPDTEPIAQYNKELAKRMATQRHKVTIVTYGKYPEQIEGVSIITTDKRKFSLMRIIDYTIKLGKETKKSNIIYVQNGASVELPILLITSIIKKPFIFFETDTNALRRAEKNIFLKILHRAVRRRARAIITETPPLRPEILPFSAYPEKEFLKYEANWDAYIKTLSKITS